MLSHRRPARRWTVTVEPVADPKHSHEWAHLHFVVPPNAAGGITKYEVRVSRAADLRATRRRSSGGCRARPRAKTEGLMVPADKRRGRRSTSTSAASTRRRTTGSVCAPSTAATGRGRTPSPSSPRGVNYTQLPPVSSGPPQCFIATAAWGSPLEPTVSAMRRARDRLLADVPLFAVAADLYGRSGPAAAQSCVAATRPGCSPGSWTRAPLATDPANSQASPQEVGRGPTSVVDNRGSAPIIPPFCARGLPDCGCQRAKTRGFSTACPRSISS